MSHGAAAPPSLATRLLHGDGCANGLQAPAPRPARVSAKDANRENGAPRQIATTAHPLFCGMLKQTLLLTGAVIVFLAGLLAGHLATTVWPHPENWFGSGRPLQAVVLEKLKGELRLTPAQTARIAPVIAASCANLRLLSEESRARRLALLDEIGVTIAPDLSSQQRRRLEDLEAEWQNRPSLKHNERIVALY